MARDILRSTVSRAIYDDLVRNAAESSEDLPEGRLRGRRRPLGPLYLFLVSEPATSTVRGASAHFKPTLVVDGGAVHPENPKALKTRNKP